MNIFSTFIKINLQNNFNTSISLESHHDGRQRYVAAVATKATASRQMPNDCSFIECFVEWSNLEEGAACHRIPQAKTCGGTHSRKAGSNSPEDFRWSREQTNGIFENTYYLISFADNNSFEVIPGELCSPHIPSTI
jgi:hypothetical protein